LIDTPRVSVCAGLFAHLCGGSSFWYWIWHMSTGGGGVAGVYPIWRYRSGDPCSQTDIDWKILLQLAHFARLPGNPRLSVKFHANAFETRNRLGVITNPNS